APLPHDFLLALSLLRLELRELVARRLPFLAGSDLVLWHLRSSYLARRLWPPRRVLGSYGTSRKTAGRWKSHRWGADPRRERRKAPGARLSQYRPRPAPGAQPDASWSPWRFAVAGATVAALTTGQS